MNINIIYVVIREQCHSSTPYGLSNHLTLLLIGLAKFQGSCCTILVPWILSHIGVLSEQAMSEQAWDRLE
jgi:hypothetical protein